MKRWNNRWWLGSACVVATAGIATATDCWLDSVIDCCENSAQFLIAAADDCGADAQTSPQLPYVIAFAGGSTAWSPTQRTCTYVDRWRPVPGEPCLDSVPLVGYCNGRQVSANAAQCGGEYEP